MTRKGRARRLVHPGVEGLDDVLALDVGRRSRLELEARAEVGLLDNRGQHDLEREVLSRLVVLALVDGPHAPRSDAATYFVAAVKDGAQGELRGSSSEVHGEDGVARRRIVANDITSEATGI